MKCNPYELEELGLWIENYPRKLHLSSLFISCLSWKFKTYQESPNKNYSVKLRVHKGQDQKGFKRSENGLEKSSHCICQNNITKEATEANFLTNSFVYVIIDYNNPLPLVREDISNMIFQFDASVRLWFGDMAQPSDPPVLCSSGRQLQ